MTDEVFTPTRTWIVRNATTVVAVAAVILYALFVQWAWGWAKVLALWQDVGLWHVLVAVILLLTTYVLRTWRIHDYFPQETRGQFPRLLRLVQVHNLLNVMMPFRTGEVSFPLLMKREFGLPLGRGASALLVMRLLDLHALLAAAGIGLALEATAASAWAAWLCFALLPALGFSIRNQALRFAYRIAPEKISSLLRELEAGLPKDASAFLRAWLATLVNWLVKVVVLAWLSCYSTICPSLQPSAARLEGSCRQCCRFTRRAVLAPIRPESPQAPWLSELLVILQPSHPSGRRRSTPTL